MSKALTGFPEWLPEQQMVEEHLIRVVRQEFELHGFSPLRTRSVEEVADLANQGETQKEIYALHRIGAPEEVGEASLALHYDLTVPFARFVGENMGRLDFPFRRYQIQAAWRGERPQLGRYREFLQADADVIVQGTLDIRYDAEMIELLRGTVAKLPIPRVRLLLNNRKLLEGFYRGLGIADIPATLRTIDKLAKIGAEKVSESLVRQGLSASQASACLRLATIEAETVAELDAVQALGVQHALLDEGLDELRFVMEYCQRHVKTGDVVGALHIARGFDYYTGTVVEGVFDEYRHLGAVCSGGRYDNLASTGSSNRKLPGVGVSIGITRILAYCFHLGLLKQPRKTPAVVFVVVHSEDERTRSVETARALRARGVACLVSDSAAAYGKQLRAAERAGIGYVWFPEFDRRPHELKDMVSGEQGPVDLATWRPGDEVASPGI